MADNEVLNLLLEGSEAWNNGFGELHYQKQEPLDLTNIDFSETNLSGFEFDLVFFNHSTFTSCYLAKVNFYRCMFFDVDFCESILQEVTFFDCVFRSCNFRKARLERSGFNKNLVDATSFDKAILTGVRMKLGKSNSNIYRVLDIPRLPFTSFNGAMLEGTDFSDSNLQTMDFTGAIVDSKTCFKNSNVKNCKIERYQLEMLSNYGGLSKSDRMSMNIVDDVAKLRANYSGFHQWFHLSALILFLTPYISFVYREWVKAQFFPDAQADHMALWKALSYYIYNGGLNWQTGPDFHSSFVAFLVLAVFNILRGTLLWKTKQLELKQEISELPVVFSLTGTWWGKLYKLSGFFVLLYLVVGLLNLFHFLTQQIPLD